MNDLIDRQTMIDLIEDDSSNGVYSCFASYKDAQKFKHKVMDLSPAQPEEIRETGISRYGVAAWLDNMGYTKLAYAVMDKDRFPSAQPERKRGRWIYGEDNLGTGRDGWFCSECGHFEMWDYSADMKSAELNLPNYCPSCGAEMREDNHETD